MKLDKNLGQTDSIMILSPTDERVEMQVNEEATAMIVNRLTDMYTRPVEATVRELMSNAIDATNRAKGKREPIKVILPTYLNQTFTVVDFGEGMSRETIREVYSQYGASTKQQDLDQVGAYGLGAKSPLSYCSQFTVESTHNGLTTELIVSSEDDGNYTRIVGTQELGKPNGTKVSIPVNMSDLSKFKSAVMSYYKYAIDVEIDYINVDYSGRILDKIGEIKIPSISSDFAINVFITEDPISLIKKSVDTNRNENFGYFLSGWNYSRRDNGDPTDYPIMIELVPGLVDFSSSRDEITMNNRFEDLNRLVKESIDDLIIKATQDFINNGKITDNQLFDCIAGLSGRYLYTEDKEFFAKLIGTVVGSDGVLFYDRFRPSSDRDIATLFSRSKGEYYSNRTSSLGIKSLSSDCEIIYLQRYSSSMQEVRQGISAGLSVDVRFLRVATWDSDEETLVVYGTNGEKDERALLNRSSHWLKNERFSDEKDFAYNVRFIATPLTKEEFKLSLKEEGIEISDVTYLSVDEYKAQSVPGIPAGKANTNNISKMIPAWMRTDLKVHELFNRDSRGMVKENSYQMYDSETIESDSRRKLLIVVPSKVSWEINRNLRSAIVNEYLKDENIVLYVTHQTAVTKDNVEEYSSIFDRVISADVINYRSKDIAGKMIPVTDVISKEEVLEVYENSYAHKLICASRPRQFASFVSSTSRRLLMSNGLESLKSETVYISSSHDEEGMANLFIKSHELTVPKEDMIKIVKSSIPRDKMMDRLDEIEEFNKMNGELLEELEWIYGSDFDDEIIVHIIRYVSDLLTLN